LTVSIDATSLQPLFTAIRAAASASTWSRGVELARAGSVIGETDSGDEILLRVASQAGLISPSVTLFPDDEDWDCDCRTRETACEHVAAAIIALRRARGEGQALPVPTRRRGHIGYRLTREGDGLAIERVVVNEGEEALLTSTLAAIASGRVAGPEFVASADDIAVEHTLGTKWRGRVPRGVLVSLLGPLSRCRDVQLDGKPIRASPLELGFSLRVEDDGTGFRVRVGRTAPILASFDDCVAHSGDELRPLANAGLLGRELSDYGGKGSHFAADEAQRLVTEVIPQLEERMPVQLETRRLPRAVKEPPRLSIETHRDGEFLEVFATLLYGEPAIARVDAGKLVPIGGGPVPLRDEPAERALLRRLQNELEILPGRRYRVSGDAALQMSARMRRFGDALRGDGHRAFFQAPEIAARFEARGDDFEVHFTSDVNGEMRSADAGRVLGAWRRGESHVALEGGGMAPLPADWLARFGDRLADLFAAREAHDRLPLALLPTLGSLCEELDEPPPPSLAGLESVLDASGEIPSASLPDDLTAELRAYQRKGVDWLCALRDAGLGALLADDMGLGKTLQALCALRGRTLVVCPTSVLPNWASETARFRPSLGVSLYHGPNRALDPDADVTLTTYALLRLDAEALTAVEWDSVVLDESQNVKNPESQAARAAHSLRADFRVALTGTPVENRLDELWSQLHFTNPGLLGGRRDFEQRYARPIDDGDTETAERLRARIRPFLLRRLKAQVAPELPPRTEIVLHAELREDEQQLYDALRAATQQDVVRQLDRGGSVLVALEALLRLRQASCHPALVPGQQASGSSKLDVLLENLDEAVSEGHKALVFSQWTSFLDLVEPHLRRASIDFSRLDGSTRDRGAVVDGFQSESGPPVLLLSLRAGGTGLNLTAADHVFILDPWWNPAVEDQAADRAHRIGQDRPVMVHRLVARGTVEERILELQARKRAVAEAALADGGAAGGLTRADLLELLA
jgi:superfamily II DNA or RNA helicase